MSLEALKKRVRGVLAPPPELEIYEWAERHFALSTENSAQPGKYRISRTPYLKGPFEAIKSPKTQEVALQFAAQTAKSTLLLATVGYALSEEPSPILFILPTLELAEDFSKDRITPMVRDSERLSTLIDVKSRDSSNTILHKHFRTGGQLTLCGANSPSSLSSRPCRWVIVDEVSRLPPSSGSEGDPLMLAKKRTSTFYNRKVIMSSTPTDIQTCKIHQIMTDPVTRRHEFRVPCPHCHAFIKLEWTQIIWDNEDPTTARYVCQLCKTVIKDTHKSKMLKGGHWVALNPEVGEFRMGYSLSALYSPWVSFDEMVREYIQAKRDALRMKVFVNTYLGEPYESETEGVEHAALYMRREAYPTGIEIPEGGLVLTCGVDCQDDRLEAEVVAWGSDDKESWSVGYYVIWGDPAEDRTWEQLSDLLNKSFRHQWGFTLQIAATAIDSGGHHTTAVYKYCKSMKTRRVFAIKGMAGEGRALVSAPSKRRVGRDRRPVDLYTVGVDSAKAVVYQKLRLNERGSGYCHFPTRDEYNQEYFKSLTSERCQVVYRNGYPTKRWFLPDHLRNEPLDCRVYALAALTILNPIWQTLEIRLATRRDEILAGIEEGFETDPEQPLSQRRPAKAVIRKGVRRSHKSSYVNSWKA